VVVTKDVISTWLVAVRMKASSGVRTPGRGRQGHSDATLYILYRESLMIYTG
jgi:hypothetical protein